MGVNPKSWKIGFKWTKGDASNPAGAIGVDNTSKALHIADIDDIGTDWNVAVDSHPSLYLHSATTPATDYVKLYHDATIAYLDVVGGTTLRLLIAGTGEVDLTASAMSPAVTDSNALGTTALMWSDLFLASGGVVNFNNGDVTLTHSANILTVGGGDLLVANGFGAVIGHTAQIAAGGVTSEFQMHGTAPADSTALLTAWSADAVPPRLYFAKSRSATIGTFGVITTGDNLGEILAFGDDGVDFNSNANASAAIIFDSAGTIDADRVPGQILIQTATNAAPSVLTTALTIDPAQKLTGAAGMALTTGNFENVAGTLDIQDGGAVTQATNKSTGVSLSTYTGQITMVNSALAADAIVSFTLTNTLIAANDIILLQHHSVGTVGSYVLTAQPGAGSCVINVANRSAGSLSDAIVISFAVVKAAIT